MSFSCASYGSCSDCSKTSGSVGETGGSTVNRGSIGERLRSPEVSPSTAFHLAQALTSPILASSSRKRNVSTNEIKKLKDFCEEMSSTSSLSYAPLINV